MTWIEVPKFGIEYFKTIKDFDSLNFRPSATSLKVAKAVEAMNEEKIEQSTMISCLKNVKTTQSDRIYSPKIVPAEITKDTKWYEGKQQPKTIFYKVKSYNGKLNFNNPILLPVDVSLYFDEIEFDDYEKIHWATSGGFACSKKENVAIAKGISELIENHFKMYWWFNKTDIYLISKKVLRTNLAFVKLVNQAIINDVDLYLLKIPEIVGSYISMCILKTSSFPYISVGFAANSVFKDAITHAIYEAIHYYRGSNWYRFIGDNEEQYIKKNKDIVSLVKETTNKSLIEREYFSDISPSIITKKFTFFAKVIHSDSSFVTTKAYSMDLQPLINSNYVPFFYPDIFNQDNVRKRNKYNGGPFI